MDWLNQYAWIGALLFARLGAVMMIAPAWGEQTTPPMMRLGLAVLVTATLAPTLVGNAPAMPRDIVGAIPMVITEIIIGLILGLGARLMMSALQVAGATVGLASGLGFAQQIDPIASQPAAIFSGFFSMMGVVLIMSAGLHRVMIEAAADSYVLFPPGAFPPIGDASTFVIDAVSNSFRLGIQIAAPVLIFSLVFNVALGLISRLIPQVQVFMTAMPLSVMLGLAITALGLGGGMMVWLQEMDRQMHILTIR
ncbi:MAG TPA: flagellar biosynthetic protein FliR [Hyphomonadaceae bacterium]|nr:flagellar biosynthetic protein FliR [Hyphomonadaceae bacterium]HPI47015.1 flagellar biosynthetic protein FliR [Hyphomonadaceae bacterium]